MRPGSQRGKEWVGGSHKASEATGKSWALARGEVTALS